MTKTRNTKSALLTSILALFLCFTMLLGTTFAWFTDSVTSANNIIKAGNLDIELYHSDKAVTDEKVGESTKLFDEVALWEPGVMVWEELTVKNEGDLALKYQLTLNVLEATKIDGVSFASMLKVALVDDGFEYTRENVEAIAADEWQDLATFTLADKLDKTENEVYGIVIWWQPSDNDNLFNMNNGNKGKEVSVKVGVTLVATQLDAENDAFGNDYDAGLTPPDEEGNILVEKDGIQYYYTVDGEYLLYLVTEDYAEETVVVPEGVTSIGNYAFSKNTNVKEVILSSSVKNLGRGFDSSTVERVVLNEGLEQIDSRAFRSTPNLKEVVISSTVKTIADNAFQKSGIKEIVIPSTVETVGETAFGASKIEKVTFEGNTSIQGYAFRGCPDLRTVVLEGDDVTFIASTLNGRNSMWFCNGESNNPNTSNITFYTENETVAARVKTAMGAEANNTKVYVDGKITIKVNSADEFANTIATATAGTVIDATGVTLEPTGSLDTTVTIPAGVTVKNAKFAASSQAYLVTSGTGEDVVFENCEFDGPGFGMFVIAGNDQDGANMVFNDCTFQGQVAPNFVQNTNGESTFNNCTFKVGSENIGLVNCMGGKHTFVGCTFDYTGGATYGSNQYVRWNAVNSYSERYSTTVILDGCTFINCGTQRYGGNSTLTVK